MTSELSERVESEVLSDLGEALDAPGAYPRWSSLESKSPSRLPTHASTADVCRSGRSTAGRLILRLL